MEQSSGQQAGEKPASEMSVEELQALLAKKQVEQQPQGESEDTSYLEMATGETFTPARPEENERIAEAIAEAEGELQTNLAEMEGAISQADVAFTQAEQALEADPHALEPKVVLEKIRDIMDRANNKMIEISSGLLIGGMVGGGVGMAMIKKGQEMGIEQSYDAMSTNAFTAYDWTTLGEQVANASTLGSVVAIAGTFALAKLARKFKEKEAKSNYFASQAV